MADLGAKPRILLLGGSGRTGQLVIKEALSRGYSVTVLVRKLESVSPQTGVTRVEGSPLVQADIEQAVGATPNQKPTIAMSTLGQTRASDNPWASPTSPRWMVADSMANLIAVAQEHSFKKIIVLSMFGTGDSFRNLNFLMRSVFMWSNMFQTLEDHNLVDERLQKSGVKFVLARAPMLKRVDLAAPIKQLGESGEQAGFMPSVSVGTVVAFLLDAVEKDTWDNSHPVISN